MLPYPPLSGLGYLTSTCTKYINFWGTVPNIRATGPGWDSPGHVHLDKRWPGRKDSFPYPDHHCEQQQWEVPPWFDLVRYLRRKHHTNTATVMKVNFL
jgi:hypothetical protein